jgi:hypothetical protein
MSPGTITDINKLNKVRLQETIIDYLETVVEQRTKLKERFRIESIVSHAKTNH